MAEHRRIQPRSRRGECRDRFEDGGAQRPAQHAARHELGGEEDNHPQEVTESTFWDTDQHSDAPGPFGTG